MSPAIGTVPLSAAESLKESAGVRIAIGLSLTACWYACSAFRSAR